jgi:hypothetical protein
MPSAAAMRTPTISTACATELAHRMVQTCGQVYRYGIATGRCTATLRAIVGGFS